MGPPDDYAAARFTRRCPERITHVKHGADRRAEQLSERIDRLADRLDTRVEKLDAEKADRADLDKATGTLEKVMFALVGFRLDRRRIGGADRAPDRGGG